MKKWYITIAFLVALGGCTALTEMAASSLIPAATKGGVSAELVVGDKEQTLGSNQEVEADTIEKVVGNSDNSITMNSAENVEVTNQQFPTWILIVVLILMVLGWADNIKPFKVFENDD